MPKDSQTIPQTALAQADDFLLSPYWDRIQVIIKSQWEPPPLDIRGQSYTVTVNFRLLRNGTARNVTIHETSGNSYFDMAAQRAVLKPRLLPPFPPEITGEYRDVSMVFRTGELAK